MRIQVKIGVSGFQQMKGKENENRTIRVKDF